MKYYMIDAFAKELFKGNQAGVCLLRRPLRDSLLQNIAAENNLSETAFIIRREHGDNDYDLRWFTPLVEIDLCGHATLASAFVVTNFVEPEIDIVNFHTLSGVLTVTRNGQLYEMTFPARKPAPIQISKLMEEVIGAKILEAHMSRDLLLLLETEEQVLRLKPNLELMKTLPGCFGVIASAKGGQADFVSRFFAPGAGIPEDPVTGSSHSTLIPFWAERLGKDKLTAHQLSKRGGVLYCENQGSKVKIAGHAALYLEGNLNID